MPTITDSNYDGNGHIDNAIPIDGLSLTHEQASDYYFDEEGEPRYPDFEEALTTALETVI